MVSNRTLTIPEAAGVVLGMTVANVTVTSTGMGVMSILDSLCAQEVGLNGGDASDCPRVGLYLRRALCAFLPLVAIFHITFQHSAPVLGHFFNDELSRHTTRYLSSFAFISASCLAMTSGVQKALASLSLTTPPLVGQAVGLTSTYLWMTVATSPMIVPESYKVEAISLAFGCARLTTLIVTVSWSVRYPAAMAAWGTWSLRQTLDPPGLISFFRMFPPSILGSYAERWTPEIISMFAASISDADVAAWGVCSSVWNLLWAVGAGVYTACGTFVGMSLGKGSADLAHRVAWRCLRLVFFIMFPLTALISIGGHQIAWIFGAGADVAPVVAKIAPLAAAVIFCDTTMYVFQGIFRATNAVRFYSMLAGAAQWIIAVPSAYLLGFKAGFGIFGVVAGLALGMTVETCVAMHRVHHTDWLGLVERTRVVLLHNHESRSVSLAGSMSSVPGAFHLANNETTPAAMGDRPSTAAAAMAAEAPPR